MDDGNNNIAENIREVIANIRASRLNAFVSLRGDAPRRAEEAASFGASPLCGLPVAVKDNIDVKGLVSTCGSRVLNMPASADAAVVEKIEKAGGIVVGKTNMDEFAMGSGNTTSAFGAVLNPLDRTRVPGGSSGGSAAAVGAGLVPLALGSDTGGSIRQPAACCGVVGFKPRVSSVDRRGLYITVPVLDSIGTLSRDVAGAKALYEVIAAASVNPCRAEGLRAAVPTTRLVRPDIEVETSFKLALNILKQLGVKIVPVDIPEFKDAEEVYGDISCYCNAEALKEIYNCRRELLGPETRRRVGIGLKTLGTDKLAVAEKRRTSIASGILSVFGIADVIITPTSPILPYKLDASPRCNPDLYTQPFSLADLPAISVPIRPCGMVGLQMASPDEDVLFGLALAYERAAAEFTWRDSQ